MVFLNRDAGGLQSRPPFPFRPFLKTYPLDQTPLVNIIVSAHPSLVNRWLVVFLLCDIFISLSELPMGIVFAIYIILLTAFLVSCALIFRHTVKFGYLSPKFRTIVTLFAVIALIVVFFSFFLIFQLLKTPSSNSYSIPTVSPSSEINF